MMPPPPAYIKVRTKFKKEKEFDRVFLAQELRCGSDRKSPPAAGSNPAPQSGSAATQNPIWAIEFSRDGRYLAAGGQDRVVRVWAVIASSEERRAYEHHEGGVLADEGEARRLSAPVFQQKAVREYHGHTSTILDLSWSKVCFEMRGFGRVRTDKCRITFSFLRPWIRRCACGMLAAMRIFARSNTRILFHRFSFTPRMIGFSSLVRWMLSSDYGAFRTRALRIRRQYRI